MRRYDCDLKNTNGCSYNGRICLESLEIKQKII